MTVTLGVEEFQGLYGPFQVSERVLQKIWLKLAFNAGGLKDERDRPIRVHFPGCWNRLEGPDFKDAIFEIDGVRTQGDVEIHFARRDWEYHGHHLNPEFDGVKLHVVYRPWRSGDLATRTLSGKAIPTATLIDLLWYDLEEYACEDSILESTGSESEAAVEALGSRSLDSRRKLLRDGASARWDEKLRFAGQRVDRLGWAEACHFTVLEVLGYASNRIPMLRVASEWPWERFSALRPDVDALWDAGVSGWRVSGVRPANHPRLRLEQYLEWSRLVPDWPEALARLGAELEQRALGETTCDAFRRLAGLKSLRQSFFEKVAGAAVAGAKFDTLVCDGFLPLLSARLERNLSGYWEHWYSGNVPDDLVLGLKRLGVLESPRFPRSNGWNQGLLRMRQEEDIARRETP